MEENVRDPREDISYIRAILEKTADGMKGAASWFVRLGIIWLVYGILCAAQRLASLAVSLTTTAAIGMVVSVVGWLFYIVLAVGFIAVRRQLARQGGGMLAGKLVDIWGVCIWVFLVLTVCLILIRAAAVRLMAFSPASADRLARYSAVCQSFLIFVLPLVPILITAVFLENRRLLWAGSAVSVLAAVVLSCHTLLIGSEDLSVRPVWIILLTAAVCVLDAAPGVFLLVFGRELKRT